MHMSYTNCASNVRDKFKIFFRFRILTPAQKVPLARLRITSCGQAERAERCIEFIEMTQSVDIYRFRPIHYM